MTDILIVEDDKELSVLLTDFLRAEGYTVSAVESGERAVQLFERYGARLVVLDINLPDMNGFAVCSKLRENADTPILIVSARTDKEDKLNGLDLGADDYIEKPYDIDILLAKIKGIFKRRYQRSMLSASGVTLNLANRTAEIDGKPVELAAKEFDLLALLIENQGKALKKEYLFSTIWGSDSDSELQTLNVHINRLRQKAIDDKAFAEAHPNITVVNSQQVNTLISFVDGSAEIDELQQVNVYTTAEALKRVSDADLYITVLGHQSNDANLFMQRANNIRTSLMNDYGIAAGRIYMEKDPAVVEALDKTRNCVIMYINE